jgi:peptide/nickel transport system substrate-binding protein
VKRSVSFVLFILVFALFPLAVTGQGSADTVVIRGLGNIKNFNPILASDGASFQAYSLLWPPPFEVDGKTGQAVPGLTSWTISDDNLTYTFKILPDAVWSDGKPITSADMKFVIDAVKSDKVESTLKSNAELIKEVKIVDDKTYQITLSSVNCAALSDFGQFRFVPSYRFKPDFSDVATNTLNTQPDISGGPYLLDEWKPDEFQRYTANPKYFKGEPKIKHLVNRVMEDTGVMLQGLQAGEVDYANMQGDQFEQIANKDSLQYQTFPQITVSFLSLNWADPSSPSAAYDKDGKKIEQKPHPIFSDVRVRQAVAMGYNKADILSSLGENGGTPLLSFVVPTINWAYNTDVQPWPYDPEKAGQLLDEAGWKMGSDGIREKDGKKLSFTISYSDLIKSFETTALVAQDQLKKIGMDVQLKKLEWAAYLDEVYFGQKYDATPISNSGGTGGAPDPNDFASLLLSKQDVPGGGGNNLASYVNPEVDKLLDQARTVPGCKPEDRAPIYKQIQKITHDDVAYDFTFTPNIYQIANKRIGNFNPSALWVYYGYTDHVGEWTINP